jgi:hypothetical protein
MANDYPDGADYAVRTIQREALLLISVRNRDYTLLQAQMPTERRKDIRRNIGRRSNNERNTKIYKL